MSLICLERILALMAEKRLSVSALSRGIGRHRTTVSRMLNGHQPITGDEATAIAGTLEIPVEEILNIKTGAKINQDEAEMLALFRSADTRARAELIGYARARVAQKQCDSPSNNPEQIGELAASVFRRHCDERGHVNQEDI